MVTASRPTVTLGPTVVDITGVRAGDVNPVGFYLHHGPDPVDLTGAVITAQARKTATDETVVLDGTVEVDDDPTSGRFVVRWDGLAVRALLADKATWTRGLGRTGGPRSIEAPWPPSPPGSSPAEMDVTR